jgi:DNA-binding GntR family transcriptional regulator
MMAATPPIQDTRFDHGLRRQAIVRSVLADVFQGRLQAGERLVTEALAIRFGVSHTPIRESLIELAGMGVVDVIPNRGAVVRRVSARDVRAVCQVRRALECEAVRTACGRVDPVALTGLADEIGRMNSAGDPTERVAVARDLDNRLHDLIAASCGNGFLAAELTRLKLLFRAFRDVAWQREEAHNDFQRLEHEAEEHLAIVQSLLNNNRKAAIRAMARHIGSAVRYWSRVTDDVTDSK